MKANKTTESTESILAESSRKVFSSYGMPEWAARYLYIKEGGLWKSFSFDGHAPLKELYENFDCSHIVVRKAAQLGVSTYSVARAIYSGERYGISTAYFFPTDTDVDDFVDDKFNAMVKSSRHLSEILSYTDTDNKGLKVFRNFNVYFRGVYTKRKVKSISVDFVIKDEVDEANQENLKFADDRMLHSTFKWIVELSQPSVDDFGIDASFKRSDMRFWGVRCVCKNWVFPDEVFPDCIITRAKIEPYLGCPKCSKKIDIQKGMWIPKVTTAKTDRKGYHLSHLLFGILEPKSLLDEFKNLQSSIEKKNFYISKLGLPYSSKNSKPITIQVLNQAQGDYPISTAHRHSYCGIDVGDKCHLVFGHHSDGRLRVHFMEELPADDEALIVKSLKRQNVICGIIDAMPYKTLSKNIARAFQGRFYIQYFKGDTLKTSMEGESDKAVPKLTVNRTESLDDTIEMLLENRILLPSLKQCSGKVLENYNVFRQHLQFLIKEPVERANGTLEYEYKKNVPNHYGMALNSMRIASELSSYNVYTGIKPVFLDL
jgi:hypothetical protein